MVMEGEICCPDNNEDRVAIGKGDSCCGTIPYSTSGSQICCAGRSFHYCFIPMHHSFILVFIDYNDS
jgi:hypothetical protein